MSILAESDMTHQLRSDQISSSVSSDSTNIQKSDARNLTVLKSCFAASLPDMINPIFVSENISSILQERKSQLRTHQFPMNCSICLCRDDLRGVPISWQISRYGYPAHIHSDVYPFPFANKNVVVFG